MGVANPGDNNSDSQRDRVLHGIGRVAQAHVGLDLKLRQLYTALGVPFALAGALTETELVPSGWNFKKLVAECRSRLRDGPWDGGLRDAGERVMAEALNVNELRDRVVHDMWVERPAEEAQDKSMERWQLRRTGYAFSAHASDLTFIDKTEERLRRVEIRANEMLFYAMSELAGMPEDSDREREEQLMIINDHFSLQANGSYRPDPPKSDAPPA